MDVGKGVMISKLLSEPKTIDNFHSILYRNVNSDKIVVTIGSIQPRQTAKKPLSNCTCINSVTALPYSVLYAFNRILISFQANED